MAGKSHMERAGLLGAAAMLAMAGFSNGASAYTYKTLYDFCSQDKCSDGASPHDLVMDQDGNLYGTTDSGGNRKYDQFHRGNGTVFEYSPSTGQYQVLYQFCPQRGCVDGAQPYYVKLVIDKAGNLYGTTHAGGVDAAGIGVGVVFELVKKDGWREQVLHNFCTKVSKDRRCKDGGYPFVGLTYSGAASGAPYDGISPLYGTTDDGYCSLGCGKVYALLPKKSGKEWTQQTLYNFCPQDDSCLDGRDPDSPLYIDDSGNLFGTTSLGGQYGQGVIYELSPNGDGKYSFNVIHNFCAEAKCVDGYQSYFGVTPDGIGNLVGAVPGGASGNGVLYRLTPQGGGGWQYNIFAEFDEKKNGIGPESLTLGSDGSLFGATSYGGANKEKKSGAGTVFNYNGAIQSLYSFCSEPECADGKRPYGNVIQDAQGNLFGTTELQAGHNTGVLYELVNDKPVHRAK